MFDTPADEALFRFVAKHGRVNPTLRDAVERAARTARATAVEALCDGGWLDEVALVDLFQHQLHLPHVAVVDQTALPAGIDHELLRQRLAVATAIEDGRLLLAMANPLDYEVIERLRFASGLRVVPAVALLSEIRSAQHDAPAADEPSAEAMSAEALHAEASNSPIVKMAALLVERGVALRASDIHLEPTQNGLTVRYRIDGVLEEATRLSAAVRNPLIARLKVMARLDIAERRVPQDGGITLSVAGRRIDCRVSTLPTQYGEKVVIRLLDAQRALVQLDELGFEPDELAAINACLGQPEGMILTTGPTGSGKSTTLYAMLQAIHSPEVNIVTVENPIEYRLAGINQTEVNERQGMTFAAALRSILRQDPDVILIGEIRDRETAEIAVQAAQTGHLVLSTLHTNDAIGAVTRLGKLGIEGELLASTLLAVIAQRLVRRVCDQCAAPVAVDDTCPAVIRRAIGDVPPRRGSGCPTCRGTGYRGRVGVYEVVRNSTALKRLIHAGASELDLRALARQQGARTLMEAAVEKIRRGMTSIEEITAAVAEEQRSELCPGCGSLLARGDRCAACAAGTSDGPLPTEAPPGPPGQPARSPAAGAGCDDAAALKETVVAISAPKVFAVGSVLGGAVHGLCVAGGLDDVAAGELELAVVEACGFAAAGGTSGDLRIEVEIWAEGCAVCVADEGPAWPWPRPSARTPDLESFAGEVVSPEARAFLIRSSVDEASYERGERTNRLWLIKRRAEPAERGGFHDEPPSITTH